MSSALAASDVAASLTLQELELIETFLSRRLDLAPQVREQTAQVIADRIARKLNMPADARHSAEDFLEGVAREFRDAARFKA